ncbi:MAG: DNA topoisomerase (ATP-hydrolyzing) subunit A [Oscillospiraceae bacterium]|nr:DNA topoisomerase (ATP-hydrolyzing) subunit A [Oscillospiraceae bacterium]
MPKKPKAPVTLSHAPLRKEPITQTLKQNYMPYAMSVIISRAIPEIDGFKPSHRKLLYTMYKMGLLTGGRTKSANVVGQTMRLNPHGEGAIYETMVRLARGNESLLHPFVDSKGNFGKVYSRDMAYAASRYTEVKLDDICKEIFADIDSDTVDFTDNYDNTMREPSLLPTAFPNVLVSANQGIAVGMASQMCGFNLSEVCQTAVRYMKNPNCDLLETLPAPDFPTGGELLCDQDEMRALYDAGRGSFKVRARWRHDPKEGVIEIFEIPYSTTAEAIIDAVGKLIKDGKLRDVADMRDETDLSGLKLTVDLKRGADPEKVMKFLFQKTPLMDSFSCNFNLLIAGTPRVLSVRGVLEEWCAWRRECVRRRVFFQAGKLKEKLHLLYALQKVLLDIDRAIRVIRETEEESDVVPNLMIAFAIDETQASFIADIRLRNINKQYILKRVEEVSALEAELADLQDTLQTPSKIDRIITDELKAIDKKHGKPRKTLLIYGHTEEKVVETAEDYPVHVFLSREGYLKKITPLSLRMSGEHKYKEGDGPSLQWEGNNRDEILVFTDRQQCYKARLHEFDDAKASVLGDYLPSKLGMDEGETVSFASLPGEDYAGHIFFFFENGRTARVELSSYATLSNRRKLQNAYSDKSPLTAALVLREDAEMAVFTSDKRCVIFHTASLEPKTTRSTQGVGVVSVKPRQRVVAVKPADGCGILNKARFRVRSLPAVGAAVKPEDIGEEQLTL